MNKKSYFIAWILILAGAFIYATCRQNVIFLAPFRGTRFLKWIKIDYRYHRGNPFIYFFLFCLSDSLWYAALLLIQKQFYSQSIISKILFYVAVALPFVLEFLQYFKVLPGTFDIADIGFYLLTLLIFLILWKRKQEV